MIEEAQSMLPRREKIVMLISLKGTVSVNLLLRNDEYGNIGKKLHEAVIASEKKDDILFITDVLGGSPFQIAAKIGQSIEVIRNLAIEWDQESITSLLYHQTKLHVFDGEKHHVDGI